MPRQILAALPLWPLLAMPAAAASADLVLPWGDALVALLQGAASATLPLAAAGLAALAARFAGPLRLLVTTALVERLVRNVADYALNAVGGAVMNLLRFNGERFGE